MVPWQNSSKSWGDIMSGSKLADPRTPEDFNILATASEQNSLPGPEKGFLHFLWNFFPIIVRTNPNTPM